MHSVVLYLLTETQLSAETYKARVLLIAMATSLQVGGAVAEQLVQGREQSRVVFPGKAWGGGGCVQRLQNIQAC